MDEESTRRTYPNTNFKEEQITAEKLNYRAAQHIKSTFKEELTTPRKLDPEATDTLTLLIENTTRESKRLVQHLRNAYRYVENPDEGLKEEWKKLGERFSSNAVVPQMHLKKLTMFPKIEQEDNKGLQELGDLLLHWNVQRTMEDSVV